MSDLESTETTRVDHNLEALEIDEDGPTPVDNGATALNPGTNGANRQAMSNITAQATLAQNTIPSDILQPPDLKATAALTAARRQNLAAQKLQQLKQQTSSSGGQLNGLLASALSSVAASASAGSSGAKQAAAMKGVHLVDPALSSQLRSGVSAPLVSTGMGGSSCSTASASSGSSSSYPSASSRTALVIDGIDVNADPVPSLNVTADADALAKYLSVLSSNAACAAGAAAAAGAPIPAASAAGNGGALSGSSSAALGAADWTMQVKMLIIVRRFAQFHPDQLLQHLPGLFKPVLQAAVSERSAVQRLAITALADIFSQGAFAKTLLRTRLDGPCRILIFASARTANAFLQRAADAALTALCQLATIRLLDTLCTLHNHASKAVRQTAISSAVLCMSTAPQSFIASYLSAGASGVKILSTCMTCAATLASDGSARTREFARRFTQLIELNVTPQAIAAAMQTLPFKTAEAYKSIVASLPVMEPAPAQATAQTAPSGPASRTRSKRSTSDAASAESKSDVGAGSGAKTAGHATPAEPTFPQMLENPDTLKTADALPVSNSQSASPTEEPNASAESKPSSHHRRISSIALPVTESRRFSLLFDPVAEREAEAHSSPRKSPKAENAKAIDEGNEDVDEPSCETQQTKDEVVRASAVDEVASASSKSGHRSSSSSEASAEADSEAAPWSGEDADPEALEATFRADVAAVLIPDAQGAERASVDSKVSADRPSLVLEENEDEMNASLVGMDEQSASKAVSKTPLEDQPAPLEPTPAAIATEKDHIGTQLESARVEAKEPVLNMLPLSADLATSTPSDSGKSDSPVSTSRTPDRSSQQSEKPPSSPARSDKTIKPTSLVSPDHFGFSALRVEALSNPPSAPQSASTSCGPSSESSPQNAQPQPAPTRFGSFKVLPTPTAVVPPPNATSPQSSVNINSNIVWNPQYGQRASVASSSTSSTAAAPASTAKPVGGSNPNDGASKPSTAMVVTSSGFVTSTNLSGGLQRTSTESAQSTSNNPIIGVSKSFSGAASFESAFGATPAGSGAAADWGLDSKPLTRSFSANKHIDAFGAAFPLHQTMIESSTSQKSLPPASSSSSVTSAVGPSVTTPQSQLLTGQSQVGPAIAASDATKTSIATQPTAKPEARQQSMASAQSGTERSANEYEAAGSALLGQMTEKLKQARSARSFTSVSGFTSVFAEAAGELGLPAEFVAVPQAQQVQEPKPEPIVNQGATAVQAQPSGTQHHVGDVTSSNVAPTSSGVTATPAPAQTPSSSTTAKGTSSSRVTTPVAPRRELTQGPESASNVARRLLGTPSTSLAPSLLNQTVNPDTTLNMTSCSFYDFGSVPNNIMVPDLPSVEGLAIPPLPIVPSEFFSAAEALEALQALRSFIHVCTEVVNRANQMYEQQLSSAQQQHMQGQYPQDVMQSLLRLKLQSRATSSSALLAASEAVSQFNRINAWLQEFKSKQQTEHEAGFAALSQGLTNLLHSSQKNQ